MASQSRHRPDFVAQGTWRSGALHVWGWNGIDTASMAWMYGGFRKIGDDGMRTGWHDTPISYGAIGRIMIDVPEQPTLHASSVQLDAMGTAVWLSDLPPADLLSDSLAWFARAAELARRAVSAGQILPVIVDEGLFTVGKWVPAATPQIDAALEALDKSMPPICVAGSSANATTIFAQLVDGIARSFLHQGGWKPDLGRQRKPEVQALRATFGALAKPDHVIRGGSDDFDSALHRLRDELDRHQRRVGGEPVLVPRLRLLIPEDPLEPWIVRVELVDDHDGARWCTANDVWEGNETALEVAQGEGHLSLLGELISATVQRISEIPGLADLTEQEQPNQVELELDVAEEFIDIGPAELEQLGVELIGPERLIRTRVAVSGEATPAPADDRRKQFGKEALIEWKLVIGDEEISDAEIARAEEAGATLLHTGHRWVRIDADELRRRRSRLTELKNDHSRVQPLELIRLAGENADAEDADRSLVFTDSTGDDQSPTANSASEFDWVRNLLAGLPDEQLDEVHESSEFVGELRHYQRRGLSWMQFLAKLGLGGCLADDMGLGKTATTLAHLIERPGPHLVVCPLSVVHNWSLESKRFTPKLDVRIHHGVNRTRAGNGSLQGNDSLFQSDPENQLVVTTYGLLPRDLEHLGSIQWSTVVLDEAQMVKNPNTKAARAVRQLKAAQKLALTGTPVENRLSELWSILDAVNPGLLGNLTRFRERFGTPIERHGDADAAARLRRITQPFILRRTKADRRLLPDLPDKIEQVAYAKLTREQATLYQQVVDQLLEDAEQSSGMRRRGLVLAALMRLKQICNHPAHALRDGSRLAGRSGKLTRFDELVTDLLDQDERALVFTQFREMGELLQQHINEQFNFDASFLHGGVTMKNRSEMVESFQDGSSPPILLISLKAGGTGLNLTAASQVIHYDRWWNPAVEDQATDRAWRIGQTQTVNVHKLVCEGTVEERIGVVIDDKRKLADSVIGNSEAWLSELSTSELRDLVVLETES
ncbi:MAG: DEAD/DEAH box helicase [Ilumatobacteraceae bacterium]|nr:DEAD/DEAH box helicase [Ilumatobacteraceae bacterium]